MFYSHTFLARKGPLGTVWCAAHLQHRLKKSHYTSTDIPSTVGRIMYPEVPIALRMSGHLLLGVVRIYSKKVDYLYQDYNFFLISIRKAFASVEVNLPEDATHAPFHVVTLPDTFELDALDLDVDFYCKGVKDNHHRSQGEITIDQIPIERDPYISITFDKDISRNSLHSVDPSGSGATPMEEDAHPSLLVDPSARLQDPDPSDQARASNRLDEDSFLQNIPEKEVIRDAVHDFHLDHIPPWRDGGNDVIEPDRTLELQLINDKEIIAPAAEEISASGGHSLPLDHREPINSAASDRAPDVSDSHISFGHASPNLAIRSTPPADQPNARPKKRKQLYDESTVLTNKFMKGAIDNCSDLLRKRKCRPSSMLDVWKSNNRLQKEKVFLEPLMTGLCADLCNIYKRDFISTKSHLVAMEEVFPESGGPHSFSPECDYEAPVGNNILPEIVGSPNRFTPETGFMSSPYRRDSFTPVPANNFGSQLEPQLGTTVGNEVQPTPDRTASTGTFESEMVTPTTFKGRRLGLENTGLSDIPEVMNSAEADDLNFLAVEDYTPTKLQRTQGVETLSGTTRKVAQYLKGKSSTTPSSEELSGNLILNNLLEGKSRKVCARMFFETLVLKCRGLIDAHQKEPYGDITLTLTPELLKDQI